MSRLRAEGLGIALGGQAVLQHVDIQLSGGELLGLLGANGAGKSTLLRLLAGLLAPHHGQVLLEDRPLEQWPRRERARRLAYLAQSADCHWDLRVADIVALGRLPHCGPFAGLGMMDHAAIERALQQTDLTPLAARRFATLSGGERMRVLLARALAGEPALLLADEPVTSLDPAQQLEMMAQLQQLARRGTAVTVVLHDLALAARFCDRLVLLHGGQVLASGDVDTVLADEPLATAYGIAVQRLRVDGRELPVTIARI